MDLHYKASNEHVENQIIVGLKNGKCKVSRYCEDFYNSQDGVMVKQIVNHEHLFGGDSKASLDDHWVIKKKIANQHPTNRKETKPTHDPKTEKVVRFNIIGFEIERNEQHITTFDIVFLNGFNNQYFLVCCEKFSTSAPENYKTNYVQHLKNIGAISCISKYQQYLEHYTIGSYHQTVNKFHPSFALIETLIETQKQSKLSLSQIECLMVLCQQISLRKQVDFERVIVQIDSATFSGQTDLFSEILGDKWELQQDSVQVFKSWAFFPIQRLTQPIFNSMDLVYESPHLYRYLISCKYGNLLAGNILTLIYKVEDEESPLFKLAKECNVPINKIYPQLDEYPLILLKRNRKELNTESEDPRLWYFHPTNLDPTNPKLALSNFKKLLFGMDWYLICLYILGMKFKEHSDTVKSLLKQYNLGLYYHFLRQSSNDISERIKLSEKAVAYGITDDLDLINAEAANEGYACLWVFLAGLLKQEQLEEITN